MFFSKENLFFLFLVDVVQPAEFSGRECDEGVEVLPMNLLDEASLDNFEESGPLCRFILNTDSLPQLDNDDIEVINSFGRLLEDAFGEL